MKSTKLLKKKFAMEIHGESNGHPILYYNFIWGGEGLGGCSILPR
jgi:hypothetical protein